MPIIFRETVGKIFPTRQKHPAFRANIAYLSCGIGLAHGRHAFSNQHQDEEKRMRNFCAVIAMSLISVAMASLTFADGGVWGNVTIQHKTLNHPSEISQYLKQNSKQAHFLFNNALADIVTGRAPEKVVRLELSTISAEWQGPTKCQANDSRLKRTETRMETVCTQGESEPEKCVIADYAPFKNVDPCARQRTPHND